MQAVWFLFMGIALLDLLLMVGMVCMVSRGFSSFELPDATLRKSGRMHEVPLMENMRSALFLCSGFHRFGSLSCYLHVVPYGRVSADYWDVIEVGSSKAIVVMADVSGHGLGASMVCLLLRHWFRGFEAYREDPPEIIARINALFCEVFYGSGLYVTVAYSVLHLKERWMESVSAGHPSPLLVQRDTGKVMSMIHAKNTNVFVGAVPGVRFESVRSEVADECFLLYYTDGIKEVRNAQGDFYGTRRMYEFCSRHAFMSLSDFTKAFSEDLNTFKQGTPLADDQTILVLQF